MKVVALYFYSNRQVVYTLTALFIAIYFIHKASDIESSQLIQIAEVSQILLEQLKKPAN